MTCDHPDFIANVAVNRITDGAVWYADLMIKCADCGQQMRFLGMPMGLSPTGPMCDPTETEARLPFAPYSEEEANRRFLDAHPAGFVISGGAVAAEAERAAIRGRAQTMLDLFRAEGKVAGPRGVATRERNVGAAGAMIALLRWIDARKEGVN